MALAKELQKLKDQTSEDGYLTIYLQTDQTSNDQQRGEWKIRLKNGLKKIEEYIEVENKVNIKRFKQVKKRATDAIYAIQTQLPKSIVIFASPQGNFFMRKLAVPVENQFSWAKEPMTEQLEEINKRYPKEGIVFLQKKICI
ncbi:hypothetical protein JCM9140_2026 [Halalkalibacter wakoensis JCM 9140]|uniref:Uncharacterized protein n=1 Tax=Halalkalibacter wakoensis JCM 9140 TaxID=1236970 RepID=W4Q2R1_9BACI|nr:hypothetical protein [Halalkalibacter wakoensis]GAE25998.1 hypothetical protein JCM9140_2026 [Halalkalibacter wakoensis JCM 9140]